MILIDHYPQHVSSLPPAVQQEIIYMFLCSSASRKLEPFMNLFSLILFLESNHLLNSIDLNLALNQQQILEG